VAGRGRARGQPPRADRGGTAAGARTALRPDCQAVVPRAPGSSREYSIGHLEAVPWSGAHPANAPADSRRRRHRFRRGTVDRPRIGLGGPCRRRCAPRGNLLGLLARVVHPELACCSEARGVARDAKYRSCVTPPRSPAALAAPDPHGAAATADLRVSGTGGSCARASPRCAGGPSPRPSPCPPSASAAPA
jgi:hypothetical protein